jgi:undecaprenyl-diphosphatase
MPVDLWLFELLNGFAGQAPVLDKIMQALVSDYLSPTLQTLALFGFWFEGRTATDRRVNQRAVLRAVLVLLISGALVSLSNVLYFRDRPFRYHEATVLFYYPTDSAFPSNSAAVMFGLAAAIWLVDRRWGWPMMALAAAFGTSRVYCGVHYPGDILGGFVVGAGTAWALTRYGQSLNRLFDGIIAVARKLYLA